MRAPRFAALFAALLTVLPTVSIAQLAEGPQLPPHGPDYTFLAGLETPLECPAEARLIVRDPVAAASPTGGRFAALTLTGAEGAIVLNGARVGEAEAGTAFHLLLKPSAAGEVVLTRCVPGATALVVFRDAPIVETLDLPARVVTVSYTRPGLRAVGMDNLVEVFIVAPAAGNVSFQLSAEGAPVPSTLEAFGEHAQAAAQPWGRALGRAAEEPAAEALKEHFLGSLVRLALACGPAPPLSPVPLQRWVLGLTERRPEVCAGQELDALLARYDVPSPAARDLAHRLAADPRCTVPAQIDALAEGLDWTPLHPLPCLRSVEEWLDGALVAEGMPPVGDLEERVATALGLRANVSEVTLRDLQSPMGLLGLADSPCADRPAPNVSAVANRTLPSRQQECAELIVASLRPVRAMWQHNGLIERMTSFDFGASMLAVPTEGAGEGKLTMATQGPVVIELAIDFAFPGTIGQVAAPARAAVREALAGLGLAPKEPALLSELDRLPLDLALPNELAELAADAVEERVSAVASAALDELEQRLTAPACSIDLAGPDVGEGCAPVAPRMPVLTGELLGMVPVWETAPAEALPATAPEGYAEGDAEGALRAFLAPPGTPLAFRSLATAPREEGLARSLLGAQDAVLFVPHRLDVRFGPPGAVEPPPDAAAVLFVPPGARDAAAQAEAFGAERFDDLLDVLAARGLPRVDRRGDVPVELLLVGTTFRASQERGFANTTREEDTVRLLNLREGVARQDLDLDGVQDRVEAQLAAHVTPPRFPYGANASVALDPLNPDSDGDGMPDGYELLQCSDGAHPSPVCRAGLVPWQRDAARDADADLLANGDEFTRTALALLDDACFATLRWACLADRVEAALDEPCAGPPVLLAWSPEEGASLDGDCDGFEDGWEARMGFDPLRPSTPAADEDADGDAMTNREEHAFYVDTVADYQRQFEASRASAVAAVSAPGPFGALLHPLAFDTDADGLPDGYEAARGLWMDGDEAWTRPDPRTLPRRLLSLQADSGADPDGDGVASLEEFTWSATRLADAHPELELPALLRQLTVGGMHPFARDTDRDGLPDREELDGFALGLPCRDPVVASLDCDRDGLEDKVERWLAGVPQEPEADLWAQQNYPCWVRPEDLTDKLAIAWEVADSDADGIADGYECWFALDPSLGSDAALDRDGDGLTSLKEFDLTLALSPEHRDDVGFFRPGPQGEGRALIPSELPFSGLAIDHDTDGVPDTYEAAVGLDPFASDADVDTDADGILTPVEFTLRDLTGNSSRDRFWADVASGVRDDELLGFAAELRLDPRDLDSDGDGLPDGWEDHFGLDPFAPADGPQDPDADGATNLDEYRFAFERHRAGVEAEGVDYLWAAPLRSPDPLDADTDGDGMPDGFELRYFAEQACGLTDTYDTGSTTGSGWAHCFDPLDRRDARDDFDGDGLTNLEEAMGWPVRIVQLKQRDPVMGDRNVTTTLQAHPNPLRFDTSGGGLSDLEKVPRFLPGCAGQPTGLDPGSTDTDGDGVTDLVEVWQWTAVPGIAFDIDHDCFPNGADSDSDGDSYHWGDELVVDLRDGPELDLKLSEPTSADTDHDLIPDGRELFQWRMAGFNPANLSTDFDGDGILPVRDYDSDVDLIPDGYEFRTGLNASEWHNETHDSDGEGLADLCEWRLVGGAT